MNTESLLFEFNISAGRAQLILNNFYGILHFFGFDEPDWRVRKDVPADVAGYFHTVKPSDLVLTDKLIYFGENVRVFYIIHEFLHFIDYNIHNNITMSEDHIDESAATYMTAWGVGNLTPEERSKHFTNTCCC